MRAVIYTRVSSEMQTDGYSRDVQLDACQKLCAGRDWTVVHHYSDVDSARTTERRDFQKMLLAAEWHEYDIIAVHKLDRFSRSVIDTLTLVRDLSAKGISVVSATEPFDLTTVMGRNTLTMLSMWAEGFVLNLSEETKKGKLGRARKGRWNGMIPFGYAVHYRKDGGDGMPRINPDTAPGVRLAFEQYATGQYSDRQIAVLLNQADYRPQGRGQRALRLWSKDSVCYLLRNRFYLGEVPYRGQWLPGQHESIITPELWQACEHERATRRHLRTISCGGRVFPLSGLARCARCGWPMRGHSTPTNQIRYYRDPAYEQNRPCNQRLVRAEDAEDALGAFLAGVRIPAEWQTVVLRYINQSTMPDTAQTKTRLQQALDRIKQLYQWGDIAEDEYLAERNRIQAELAAIQPPRMPNLERAAAMLQDFAAIWTEATPTERRVILRSLLDAIYLDAEHGPVVAIKPKPDLAVLFNMTEAGTTGVTPSSVIYLTPEDTPCQLVPIA